MTIALEKLLAVKTIVVHDKCPDGIISALILQDALGDVAVKFVQYQTPEADALVAEPGMLFCDFSPPPNRAEDFVKVGAIVLDHHKTAEAVVRLFGGDGIYADEPGVSGATLAYREVWRPIYESVKDDPSRNKCSQHPAFIEETATIAGIRDTWQKTDPRWEDACIQAQGVLFPPMEYFTNNGDMILGSEWRKLLWCGKIRLDKIRKTAARAVRDGFKFTTPKGTKVVVFSGVKLASDAAEVPEAADFDLIVGFDVFVDHGVPKLICSTRSRKEFDCAAFCKANGGGGHLRAAGFNIENPTLIPWAHVQERVLAFEQ